MSSSQMEAALIYLRDISKRVDSAEHVALIGRSGSGETTD